jgi:AAA15 family ATPase/GTPase
MQFMNFFLSNSYKLQSAERRNIVILFHSDWDDWFTYSTLYSVVYYDKEGVEFDLGSIKIGQFNMEEGQRTPNLPEIFKSLSHDFFSLGQDSSYYENLNKFGDSFRKGMLEALNDLAYNADLYHKALNENVTASSLLRDVSQLSVEGQFRNLANGNPDLTQYSFQYHYPKNNDLILDFNVTPYTNPPTNLQVIIGRNGVGKTYLFENMINTLMSSEITNNEYGYFTDNYWDVSNKIFANLIFISYSSFDKIFPRREEKDKLENIKYSYIGLKVFDRDRDDVRSKNPEDYEIEFKESLNKCFLQGKDQNWSDTLKILEGDPLFKYYNITSIITEDKTGHNIPTGKVVELFKNLSSGHKIVLLTITKLIETLEEKSLVIMDEPETYLHPPLISSYIRAISHLLIKKNAVAIVGTHSPVILQEVPKDCVWSIRRVGNQSHVERLQIESFGENVGSLTQEVFGLEVTNSGFHNILKSLVSKYDTYEDALEALNGRLGIEGRAILRNLFYSKGKNEKYQETRF